MNGREAGEIQAQFSQNYSAEFGPARNGFKSPNNILISNQVIKAQSSSYLYKGPSAALSSKLSELSLFCARLQEPSEPGETTGCEYVRSAVTGGLGIALKLEPQLCLHASRCGAP